MKIHAWIGALALVVASCLPPRYAEVDVYSGPQWYTYCTWDSPCYYPSSLVFVYGWGWLPRPRYVYFVSHPNARPNREGSWVPDRRPERHEFERNHRPDHDRDRDKGRHK